MSGAAASSLRSRPRIGFVGVGWIGRHRMQAIIDSDQVDVLGIVDPVDELAREALELSEGAERFSSYDELLSSGIDGVVIATPSAMHADQSLRALERGVAVFCQKPLGRTAHETSRVVEAARSGDHLLGVDFSYRHTAVVRAAKTLIDSGEIGDVFACELVFHNAWGPDKPWFYEPARSGGGCVIDLGIHLIDLALLLTGASSAEVTDSRLFSGGRPLRDPSAQVEDYADVTLTTGDGVAARIGCSWNLHAGWEAVIGINVHGTDGSVAISNVNGSFYDFVAHRCRGTSRELLVEPPDAWGGRAAAEWSAKLASGNRFDPSVESVVTVARLVDQVYGR